MDLKEQGSGSRRHPWEVARVRSVEGILWLFLDEPVHKRLLDIGCGDAFALGTIQDDFGFKRADGVDVNLTAEQMSQLSRERPGVRLHDSYNDLLHYEVMLMLDVVEHIRDDGAFIRDIVDRYLVNDGILLMTVPAFQFLFSAHDTYLGHYRRYTRHGMMTLAEGGNLEVLAGGYLFSTLLPVRLLACIYERLFRRGGTPGKGVGHWKRGDVISGVITRFILRENAVLIALSRRNIHIPGLSVWILCKKRPS